MPRERWTDERLDDLNAKVDDLRLEMRQGFARIDADMRDLNARFDALNRNLLVGAVAIIAALIGSNAF